MIILNYQHESNLNISHNKKSIRWPPLEFSIPSTKKRRGTYVNYSNCTAHVSQLKNSDRFQMFDYQSENARIYGSGIPPEYELSNFKIPVYIYQGENDSIVSPKVKFH